MKRLLVLLSMYIALSIGLGFVTNVQAQSGATTSSVAGKVTDQQNASIGGVDISIKAVATNVVRETTTTEDGSFTLPELNPGEYELTVKAEGFKTQTARFFLDLG